MSIRLSEKHGVNPTIPKCFWCGEDKNEIVFMGKLPNDAKAPRSLVLDYAPCDKCSNHFAQGVVFMVASHKPNHVGQPPMCKDAENKNAYPTGQHIVLTEDGVRQLVTDPDTADQIIQFGNTFIDEETFNFLMEQVKPMSS